MTILLLVAAGEVQGTFCAQFGVFDVQPLAIPFEDRELAPLVQNAAARHLRQLGQGDVCRGSSSTAPVPAPSGSPARRRDAPGDRLGRAGDPEGPLPSRRMRPAVGAGAAPNRVSAISDRSPAPIRPYMPTTSPRRMVKPMSSNSPSTVRPSTSSATSPELPWRTPGGCGRAPGCDRSSGGVTASSSVLRR